MPSGGEELLGAAIQFLAGEYPGEHEILKGTWGRSGYAII